MGRKFLYKMFEVGIPGNHKSRDGDLAFTGLPGHPIALIDNFGVEPYAIFVVRPVGLM